MKNMKCYGRQKYIIKEKSFVRNFFGGNKSSDASLFDDSANQILQQDSLPESSEQKVTIKPQTKLKPFSKNKENRPVGIELGTAPRDVFNFTENKGNVSSSFLHPPVLFKYSVCRGITKEQSQEESFEIKKGAKAGCAAKRVKRLRRNVKKKPKQIQHLSTKFCKSLQPRWSEFFNHDFIIEKKCSVFPSNQSESKNCRNKSLKPSSTALRENTNMHVDLVDNVYSKQKSFDTFNSLKDSFLQNFKIGKNNEEKENDINIENNCRTKLVECLKQISESNCAVINSKGNLKVQKNIVEPSEQLANMSVSFGKNGNTTQQHHKSFTSESSANLLKFEALTENQGCRNSANASVIQNVEKTEQKNDSVVEILISEVGFHTNEVPKNACGAQDFQINQNNDSSNSDCFMNISGKHISDKQNDCGFSTVNKNSQNIKLSCTRSCEQLKLSSCSLVGEAAPSEKKNTRNDEERVLCEIQNKQSVHLPNSESVCKIKNSQAGTLHSCISLEVDVSSNAAGKINYSGKRTMGNISSISNNFESLNLLERHRMSKFITSTPILKLKTGFPTNPQSLELSPLLGKHTKLIASDCNPEIDDFVFCSPANENCGNLNNKNSSQLKDNSVMCSLRKYSIQPVFKKSRSILNLSTSEVKPPVVSEEFLKLKLLELCNQDSIASFADIYKWNEFKVKKIGEGSYGEVYMISKRKLSSVLKVIPISRTPGDNYQELQSVVSEIQISMCLSGLRNNKKNHSKNFVKLIRSSVVSGSYPAVLLSAWDQFFDANSCYNERPDYFDDEQSFVILELEYGGKDMSCFVLRNSVEAECVLKQVAVSLAVAEEEFLFEHRDLHLGNILVERNRSKRISYKLQGKDISFASHGLHVTLIDFTLSRLYTDGFMYYNDLADDKSLFEQTGDYQFKVYKLMKEDLGNQWQEISFYSNVLWLKYLCQKLLEFNYSRPSTVAHKKGLKSIESFNSNLMDCSCATVCLTKCNITKLLFERVEIAPHLLRKSILMSRSSSKSKFSLCN